MKIKSSLVIASLTLSFSLSSLASSTEPDWSASAVVPEDGRANIYNWSESDFGAIDRRGKIHAQIYPVTVTGILPPYEPFRRLAEDDGSNPLKRLIGWIFRGAVGIRNFDQIMAYLGLHGYPAESDQGVYQVPYPTGTRPDTRMGFGLIERDHAKGFSFSCAGCHSANLFGKTVMGMTNRFPRANAFFVNIKPALDAVEPHLFQFWTGATDGEMALLASTRENIDRVAAKEPVILGLDTSLAQVALSLNRRQRDGWATPSEELQNSPRRDARLDDYPADSKPAVWWNIKYKNRWLSDGSVLSGNPIFTNLIWNEIGRGVDLHVLESWLAQNQGVIQELTTAVFSSEAPRMTDFFPAESINLAQAKDGEKIFEVTCARCHGHYEKAWNQPNADQLTATERLATIQVRTPERTLVVDVGTDENRRLGMKSLEQLNDLEISKTNGIVIEAQAGYVPPPLVGIWARWPYFHNNSVPDLCSLLTAGKNRPELYYSGEADDPARDFDRKCNGYPHGSRVPESWKTSEHTYDTNTVGLSNKGHDEGIFLRDGKELLSVEQKRSLIVFLQTL